MANNTPLKLLDRKTVSSNEVGTPVDIGGYSDLETQIRVHVAGGGSVQLQHAAVNESLAYVNLGTSVNFDTVDQDGVYQYFRGTFLRYLRYKVSSGVELSPVVSIDVIAKERMP